MGKDEMDAEASPTALDKKTEEPQRDPKFEQSNIFMSDEEGGAPVPIGDELNGDLKIAAPPRDAYNYQSFIDNNCRNSN